MAKNLSEAFSGDDDNVIARVKAPPKKAAAAPPKEKEPHVWIRLEDNDKIPPTGQFFSLNGRTWVLRVGVPARVPQALLNVLNDATEAVPQLDSDGMKVTGFRERLRFAYTLVKAPVEAAA